jgi:SagB-type dehydrogenase family enzyme
MRSLFDRVTGPMDPEFAGVRFPEPDLFSPSELFHESSKIGRQTAPLLGARIEMFLSHQALQRAAVHPFKLYPGVPTIPLPQPGSLTMPLGDVLTARRSVRQYDPNGLVPLTRLSTLLWASQGTTPNEYPQGRRTYPSGGGLYPLELYLAVRRAEGVAPGLYHYAARTHSLEQVGSAEKADSVFLSLTQEDAAQSAHIALLVSAVLPRTQYKYGLRGYRFALLEAGHLMQTVLLLAAPLQLGMVPLGGFYDDELHDYFHLDGVEEAFLYTAVLGPQSV